MLRFRLATPADADALAALNYRTFVEEIPQHAPNATGRLRDKFDAENTYVVAELVPDASGDGAPAAPRLVGMITLRGNRPFSLDAKLDALDAHLPPGCRPCEVRLLAVEPEHRNGAVFRGLVAELARHGLAAGYDTALISGTTRQTRLYRHIGFEPFGPLVGTPEAPYQPMRLTLDAFRAHADAFALAAALPAVPRATPGDEETQATAPPPSLAGASPGVSAGPEGEAASSELSLPGNVQAPSPEAPAVFLPGPVTLWPGVADAFARPPVSHRGEAFLDEADAARARLCALASARHVAVLLGSGTLANDVVAGQIAALGAPGVVLSTGEFGERLEDHARRWRLSHAVERRPWGTAVTAALAAEALEAHPEAAWLWLVHLETSTGALADLAGIAAVAAARGVRVAVDVVSSLGAAPVDLSGVWLAAGSSGKALGSLAGLALVFHAEAPRPAEGGTPLPRYLDLAAYAGCRGSVAYTQSSPLVRALAAALAAHPGADHLARTAADTAWLRERLAGLDVGVAVEAGAEAPGVVTLVPPPGTNALALGAALAGRGYVVSTRSGYLLARGWLQVCLMGDYPRAHLPGLVDALADALAPTRAPVAPTHDPATT